MSTFRFARIGIKLLFYLCIAGLLANLATNILSLFNLGDVDGQIPFYAAFPLLIYCIRFVSGDRCPLTRMAVASRQADRETKPADVETKGRGENVG